VHVLIVDHSAIVRQRLVELFASVEQVAVIGQAERATPAMVAMRDLRPDLVILDIPMPDRDGVAVLEVAQRLAPAPTVVVLTNLADTSRRRRCEAAGADFFLDKSKQFVAIPRFLRGLIEQGVANHG
jgi:DNA-binding NarL/FixJ family response regulator